MAKHRKPIDFSPKFKVGDKVRVKHGVKDVDYPDMPLGGWAGTVFEVDKYDTFTIRWSKETLAAIHPVFKKRCEKDGLDLEECASDRRRFGARPGGPLNIVQPTKITTKPLSPKDEDDRVRMVFGLTSNDPLPEVDDETLVVYHKYLAANLSFPFEAEHGAEYGHPEKVKVIGLGDPDEEPMIDEDVWHPLRGPSGRGKWSRCRWANWKCPRENPIGSWSRITAIGSGTIGEAESRSKQNGRICQEAASKTGIEGGQPADQRAQTASRRVVAGRHQGHCDAHQGRA